MQGENVLILSNLKEGVKTGLYDFFNKSFVVSESINKKHLKLKTKSGSVKSYTYN